MDASTFFGTEFSEDDFTLTEEEAMAIDHEIELVQEFKKDLADIRADPVLSEEQKDKAARKLLIDYLGKSE